MLLCIDTVMLVTSCCITTCPMTLSVWMSAICSIAVPDKNTGPSALPVVQAMPAPSGSKNMKPLEGEYASLGCMFSKVPVKKEVMVDSSPETSTKVGTSIVASEAPSDGSHETGAEKPVAEQPVDENPVAAKPLPEKKTFVERFFKTKENYNAFNYRLSKCEKETRDEYMRLNKEGEDDEIMEFTKAIMNSRAQVPADFFGRKRKIEETKEKIGDEGWMSWSKAVTIEGEDVLLDMIQSGAIESRVHPKLSADSKIPYPKNLQVYMVQEKIRKCDATTDEVTLQEASEVDAERHENWLKEFHTAKMELKPSSSSSPGPEQYGRSSNAGDSGDAQSEASKSHHAVTTQCTGYTYDESRRLQSSTSARM